MKIVTKTGVCRFCQQTKLIELEEGDLGLLPEKEEEMLDERATRACDCEAAMEYTRIQESKENVSLQIQALFESDHQEMGQLLIDAIEPVSQGKVKSVSIKAGEETVISAKITRTKDGTIRATRKDEATSVAEA